jgi:hypothetical protein
MTAIPSTTPTKAQTSPVKAGLRDSIAQTISALTGKKVAIADISNHNISEEVLFAANVHCELQKTEPVLAEKMLGKVSNLYQKKANDRKSQPLFRAVDQFLTQATKKGTITKRQKNKLAREAFGKAQLDDRPGRLRRRPTGRDGAVNTIDNAITVSENNKAGSRAELKKFRERIANRPEISKERAQKAQDFLSQIFPSETPSVDTKSSGENVVDTNPVDYNNFQTGKNEMVYKPVGESGGTEFLLPSIYADEVTGVTLVSTLNEEELELTHIGGTEDGRRKFSSETKGRSLEGTIVAVLNFANGDTARVDIGEADEFARHQYSDHSRNG